jgi:hypothetical protein
MIIKMEAKIMSDDMFEDYDDSFIDDHSDDLFDFDINEPMSTTELCLADEHDMLGGLNAESMGLAFALAEDISESDRVRHGFSSRRNSRVCDALRTKCLNDGFDDDELPMDPEEMYIIKYGDKYFQ